MDPSRLSDASATSPAIDMAKPSEVLITPPQGEKEELVSFTIKRKQYLVPINRPLYVAHGKWAFANGQDIVSGDPGTLLGDGLEGKVYLKVGIINDRKIVYITKKTIVWDQLRLFFSSLYLNACSKYLRPLQGDIVPSIIGVHHCQGGCLGVAQELPHPTGWREADMFLNELQKEAVIAAYQKLHDRNVLHGDVEYRHMLIGDDGKITLIDFGFSKIACKDENAAKAHVDYCSKTCLHDEMRKVKFLLDYKNSRTSELHLAKIRDAREARNRKVADDMAAQDMEDDSSENFFRRPPEEPLSEEEKAAGGALSLLDLTEWSNASSHWTAHRFEVTTFDTHAELRKTDIPRPLIPAKVENGLGTDPTNDNILSSTLTPVTPQGQTANPASHVTSSSDKEKPTALVTSLPATLTNGQTLSCSAPSSAEKGITSSPIPATVSAPLTAPTEVQDRQYPGSSDTSSKRTRDEPESDPSAKKRVKFAADTSFPRNEASYSIPESNLSQSPGTTEDEAFDFKIEDECQYIRADPTPWDLKPTIWPRVRSEVARSYARFTTAGLCVAPLQKELQMEKKRLEKCRSELLRLLLMLPPEDRVTMWTNMGSPDAQTLLGLGPDIGRATKTGENMVDTQAKHEGPHNTSTASPKKTRDKNALSGTIPPTTINPSPGSLTKPYVKTFNHGSIKKKAGVDCEKDHLLMPPPPIPIRRHKTATLSERSLLTPPPRAGPSNPRQPITSLEFQQKLLEYDLECASDTLEYPESFFEQPDASGNRWNASVTGVQQNLGPPSPTSLASDAGSSIVKTIRKFLPRFLYGIDDGPSDEKPAVKRKREECDDGTTGGSTKKVKTNYS